MQGGKREALELISGTCHRTNRSLLHFPTHLELGLPESPNRNAGHLVSWRGWFELELGARTAHSQAPASAYPVAAGRKKALHGCRHCQQRHWQSKGNTRWRHGRSRLWLLPQGLYLRYRFICDAHHHCVLLLWLFGVTWQYHHVRMSLSVYVSLAIKGGSGEA